MQRAGRAAVGFRIGISMLASFALECDGEARTLLRIIAEKRRQIRVAYTFCCLLKTFLTILQSFDQVIDYVVLLLHKYIVAFHAAFACLSLTVKQRMENESDHRAY